MKNKIVILAHTPPPLHGQSLMVALLLDTLKEVEGAKSSPSFFHIDCRYSDNLQSMGRIQLQKLFAAIRYAFQALAIRFRYEATSLYYIPAPGKRPAFLRDCVVLTLLRPFFKRVVFHWHAAGLSHWLETQASPVERWVGRKIYGGNTLSIVLLEDKIQEAVYFRPHQICVIPNGIPDPCPGFKASTVPQPDRSTQPIRLLFLSSATKEKGVFTAVSAWRVLNERAIPSNGPFYSLTIAGEFSDPEEEKEFWEFSREAQGAIHGQIPDAGKLGIGIEICGGVYGERKIATYSNADIFLFPSTYAWESFGIVLVEAAHFGLPCVTYQPLVGPQGLSPKYHRRVPFGDREAFVAAIGSISLDYPAEIRADALKKFNVALFGERMRAACLEIQPE